MEGREGKREGNGGGEGLGASEGCRSGGGEVGEGVGRSELGRLVWPAAGRRSLRGEPAGVGLRPDGFGILVGGFAAPAEFASPGKDFSYYFNLYLYICFILFNYFYLAK